MKLKRPSFPVRIVIWICVLALPVWAALAAGREHRIRRFNDSGISLKLYDNSDTMSQAHVVNDQGHVLGSRETTNEAKTIYGQSCFYSDGWSTFDIEPLEGFTNTELLQLSEVGSAVGYASRGPGDPNGSLVPIHWSAKSKTSTRLPGVRKDVTGQAHDISADGKRISGYSAGDEPSHHMLPCVWDWDESQKKWSVTALEVVEEFNPFIFGSRVLLSPDGNTVASCPTEKFIGNGIVDSSLTVWRLKDGKWEREQIADDQLKLRDINNKGEIVGDMPNKRGSKQPVFVAADGTVTTIELLEGDRSGIAWGLNDDGVVVGQSNDPPGRDGGPVAFIWRGGKTEKLKMPAKTVFSTALDINNEGEIVGMADFTFPEMITDPDTGEEEELVKAVGYIRSPVSK